MGVDGADGQRQRLTGELVPLNATTDVSLPSTIGSSHALRVILHAGGKAAVQLEDRGERVEGLAR